MTPLVIGIDPGTKQSAYVESGEYEETQFRTRRTKWRIKHEE